MVLDQIVLFKKIEEIVNKKSQKNKKRDLVHHLQNKEIKNLANIEIVIVNVIEREKEPMIGIVNVVTKENEIRRKIRIESTEIVKNEGVNNAKEVEVKTYKKTGKSKSNK